MNVSKPPKNRPKRTGARGGSRTGHKSTNCSKTASTNGSKSSLKQASHKEQQDPSRPRSARTDLLAGEHFIPQELMPGLYLSSKTSTMSSYRLGKSLPVVLNSGHDKILKVTDHVRKLSLKSTTSQQVVTCEGAEGNLNMLSQEDPQPRNFEESKYDDTFPVKEMTGEQNLSRLKETININEGNKKTGVIENKLEYLVTDDNSGLAVMAPQNGNSPKLAASGDYIPGQFAERQRYSTRQSDLSGFSDIYGRATYSETTSIYSGEWTNLDWMDSNSGLISDLCDIVRDSIMESGMKNKERFIKPALTPMMQVLVDRIIKESRNIPIQEWNANARQCPSRSSAASTNSSNGGLSSSPSARSSLVTDGKFAKNERDDELSDDDEEKLPKGPPGPDISSNEAEIGLRLSCPFQKHDPKKYNPPNYRSCASTGWNSISRVKEHLYRRHKMPIHCKRCHKQFSNVEELDCHALVPQPEVCELRLGETTEGVTPDVEKQLRRRKRVPSNQTDEECWKAIYRLLFPKDETVPDPYVESSQCEPIVSNNYPDLAEFKKYFIKT